MRTFFAHNRRWGDVRKTIHVVHCIWIQLLYWRRLCPLARELSWDYARQIGNGWILYQFMCLFFSTLLFLTTTFSSGSSKCHCLSDDVFMSFVADHKKWKFTEGVILIGPPYYRHKSRPTQIFSSCICECMRVFCFAMGNSVCRNNCGRQSQGNTCIWMTSIVVRRNCMHWNCWRSYLLLCNPFNCQNVWVWLLSGIIGATVRKNWQSDEYEFSQPLHLISRFLILPILANWTGVNLIDFVFCFYLSERSSRT